MRKNHYVFTSEAVSEGHPDKVCDRISDEILDLCLREDPDARVACETLATTNHVILAGEVRGKNITDDNGNIFAETKEKMRLAARRAIKDIGYHQQGFNWKDLTIDFRLHGQSANIAQGVDVGGAGDQGIMFGYATDETEVFMPPAIYYSNRILQELSYIRRHPENPGFGPDMKAQITLNFENHCAVGVNNIVVSAQHKEEFSQDAIRRIIRSTIKNILPKQWTLKNENLYVNPTGKFVIGGPDGDTGVTGRKIIADTYGGSAPHGGGAFSGKDATKVDRSASYIARYIAKNIVAANLARQCLIQLSYAIGVDRPLSLFVDTFDTSIIKNNVLIDAIKSTVDLSPSGIRRHLQLDRPIYSTTSAYGHFGRMPTKHGHFSWERLDLVPILKHYIASRSSL